MGRHSSGRPTGRRTRRLDTPAPGADRRSNRMVEAAPRLRIHDERRRAAIKRGLIASAIVLVVVGVGTAVWAYGTVRSFESRVQRNAINQDERLAEVLTKSKPREPFTVLLLGSDKRPDEDHARADTIIVARVDQKTGAVWMISLPRDTRVTIPGHGTNKINAASFIGGPSLMVETVEEFLGVTVNHYAEVDFVGFQKMVDALGGVWIDVDVLIDDPKASSHGSYKTKRIEPGYQLLDGEYALTFVRSRDFPDADFTRIKHQQQFFKALADQATRLDNVFKIPGIVGEIANHVATDLSVSQMIQIATALKDVGGQSVQTATIAGEWRSPFVWPDLERKDELVARMMSGAPFETTGTAEPTAAMRVEPSTVSVTVRNGAGIEGSAATTADLLRRVGYRVGEVGNANQFVYDRTLVVYTTERAAAEQVAADLPKADVVASRGMYSFSSDILVVVGKDFVTWESQSQSQ